MLDLYQQEVETHAAALDEGLVAWEADPATADFDGLMRAAHSLKGAARIVGLDDVVRVAHTLEDLFVAAGKGELSLGSDQLDWLFNAVDVLTESGRQPEEKMAAWLAGNTEWAQAVIDGLHAIREGQGEPPVSATLRAPLETSAKPTLPATTPDPPHPVEGPPDQKPDFSMMDLYRTEADSQLGALVEGLDAVGDGAGSIDWEPLMRAAHSLKGAAKIVGLDAAVELARRMEATFNAAIEGKVTLGAAQLDALRTATGYLRDFSAAPDEELAGWPQAHADDYRALTSTLDRAQQGLPITDEAPTPAINTSASPVPPDQPPLAVSAPRADAPPVPASKPSAASGKHSGPDSVVRVSAENLNRLMGLAAETLVETGQLGQFRDTLLRLKEAQSELNAKADAAEDVLDALDLKPEQRVAFAHVRQLAQRNLDLVREQLEHFDAFSRRNTLLSDRLYREVLLSRMRPFADGVQGFPRLVRDLARSLGKQIKFEIEGKETPVDRDILEKLDAPLNHILRNACDHAIEPPTERLAAGKPEAGAITLRARHRSGMLVVEIQDDGKGIDVDRLREKIAEKGLATAEMVAQMGEEEVLEFLFLPGFSTAGQVTEVSGRGVGLDVVHTLMQQVGGQARVQTTMGAGTTFHLQVPITRSVIRALLAEIDGEPYAFPLSRITRTLRLPFAALRTVESRQYFELEGQNVGLASARVALGFGGAASMISPDLDVVVIGDRNLLYGVEVDRLLGEADLVVRPLDTRLGKVPGVSAASLTDTGEPILIIDVEDLIASIDKLLSAGARLETNRGEEKTETAHQRVLVVDDSITVRETERQLLENAGYAVEVAVDGADGWNAVRLGEFDLVVSDIDMPRMNGYEFVSKIRADHRLERLPVIVVSYKDREEDRIKGLEAGADMYLTKSAFQDDSFIQAVRDLIGEDEA